MWNIPVEICVIRCFYLLTLGVRSRARRCKRQIAGGGGDNAEKLDLGLCQGAVGHCEGNMFTLLEQHEET